MSPPRKITSGASPRPAPLKVHRDSHLIHKAATSSTSPSFSSSSSPSNSDASNGSNTQQQQQQQPPQQQQRQPVIIYTHSPKIIHTQACDFMALVQKLTGLSRSEDDEGGGPAPPQPAHPHPPGRSRSDGKSAPRAAALAAASAFARNDNSSFPPENPGVAGDVHGGQLLPPAVFDPPPPNPFLSDIPLFTPNSSDLFCSPRHYYNYPTTVFSPPNVGTSISPPSVMDVMKAFHEY